MASWCGNCSGATVSVDGSRSVNLSRALELGYEARAEELQPGAHPGALTRWATDEQLWTTLMGTQSRSDYPTEVIDTIRDLFECAWDR